MKVEPFHGDRQALRPLFSLADDSEAQIAGYMRFGMVLVARDQGEIVGQILTLDAAGAGEAEIRSLAVAEACHNRGVASALIAATLARCRARGVRRLVVATAAAATDTLRFYQRRGFRVRDVVRDAFAPETRYRAGISIGGIPLRDQLILDLDLDAGRSGDGRTPPRIRLSRREDAGRIVDIWRSAVDATHDFLSASDRAEIEVAVRDFLPLTSPWLAVDAADRPLGFMLLSGAHMEALFVDAGHRGLGVGRALVEHAVGMAGLITTEVNEQNPQAVGFYERLGFLRAGRSEVDGQGRPYPLLHMRLDRLPPRTPGR